MNEVLTVVLLLAVVALIWRRVRGGRARTPQQRLAQLHRRLLSMTMNDAGVVRRLVDYERERNPQLSETGCYRAAIARMRR